MQRKRNHRNIVLAALTAASLAFGGQVSAQVIRITNVDPVRDIPLKTGSSVQIDSTGNLLAECALTNGQCTALGGGGGTGTPTANLTRTDTDADVRVGDTITLSWTSTGAEACKATSAPANGNFSGVRDTASTAMIAPATVGTHTFTLVCYNASGASAASAVSVTVGEPPAGEQPSTCNLSASDLGSVGWTRSEMTWEQLFKGRSSRTAPTYPSGYGFPVPIGASKGSYVAASFTALPNQTVNMFWDPAQANPIEGYSTARPAQGMFISISPCAGDLRKATGVGGGFLMGGCRKFANTGTIITSTSSALSQSTATACKLVAGQKYYINVLPANPDDGLTSGEHSCLEVPSSQLGCDVQARSTTN